MQPDQVQNFIFEHINARGSGVKLDTVWQTIRSQGSYPSIIQQALGELLAATALFSAHLKFNGKLSLQISGEGALRLLIVEYRTGGHLRATARMRPDLAVDEQATFLEMIGENAQLVVTIDQGAGTKPYQGVIPLLSNEIAESITEYFVRSEQLITHVVLSANEQHCAGFLLQKMPGNADDQDANPDLERVFLLAETLKAEELAKWEISEVLQKLFAEDDIRLFEPAPMVFNCSCSVERVANMIRSLGREEAFSVVEQEGELSVTCDFCQSKYRFDAVDVERLFHENQPPGTDALQ